VTVTVQILKEGHGRFENRTRARMLGLALALECFVATARKGHIA